LTHIVDIGELLASAMPQAEGDEAHPRFPPELEREIFERTAKTYQGTGVILVLVCRRVQLW
jgi:hypothetical protein